MANIIRYECDGQSAVWPIPFAYIDKGEIGVNLVLADGREKTLTEGSDYIIQGQNVISVQGPGNSLVIWQNAPKPTPQALSQAANARLSSQGTQVAQAYALRDESAGADTTAELNAALASAIEQLEKFSGIYRDEFTAEADKLKANLTAAINQLVSDAATRLEGIIADSQGKMNQAVALSESSSQNASRAAATAIASNEEMVKGRAAQDNAAITAQGWANASQKSADDSYKAACEAWDAANQASIHSRRPGVCAIQKLEDIHACSPGLFIVNPHLTHAPTPFFGVWPARSEEDMAWDAVFFISPYLYPDDPRLPPVRPVKPEPKPVEATGNGDEWLPCGHDHEEKVIYAACPCSVPPSCNCKK